MMELGTASIMEHENLVVLIKAGQWADVILVGGDFSKVEHPFHFLIPRQKQRVVTKKQEAVGHLSCKRITQHKNGNHTGSFLGRYDFYQA